MEKSSQKDHREKLFKHKLEFVLKAISAERGKQKIGPSFEKELSKLHFPIRLHVFFRQLMIRYWIRSKKWDKAFSDSNISIYKFPWVDSFYQLRAFVYLNDQKWKKALEDTLSSTKLNQSNFIALYNISEALLKYLSHFEMILLVRLFLRYDKQRTNRNCWNGSIYRKVIRPYLLKLWRDFPLEKQNLGHKTLEKIHKFCFEQFWDKYR